MKILLTLTPAVVLSAVTAFAPIAIAANLIRNPGFETGTFTGWSGNSNTTVVSVPVVFPEAINTGNHSAEIFVFDTNPPNTEPPTASTSRTVRLTQELIVPNGAPQLRFGGWLRFFSFSPFTNNFDEGRISLRVGQNPAAVVGRSLNELTPAIGFSGGNTPNISDWLFLEGVLDVDGLGGQTATLSLSLQDSGTLQDTAVVFDDLFVEAIPTPALLPGLIGLGLGCWRQRRNSNSTHENPPD